MLIYGKINLATPVYRSLSKFASFNIVVFDIHLDYLSFFLWTIKRTKGSGTFVLKFQ